MKNKLLLVIDPQVDFIIGSLSIPKAEEAMNRLSVYIKKEGDNYNRIVITADRHPLNHCSFINNKGEWPVHCVKDSIGAAIWPAIMNSLLLFPDKVAFLYKGENPLQDEYSIFKNIISSKNLIETLEQEKIRIIDICGLAGDICVAQSIIDGLNIIPNVTFNVLRDFTPSLDGGETLNSLINNKNVLCDRL